MDFTSFLVPIIHKRSRTVNKKSQSNKKGIDKWDFATYNVHIETKNTLTEQQIGGKAL